MTTSHLKLAMLAAAFLLPAGAFADEAAAPAAKAAAEAKLADGAKAKDERQCSPTATTRIRRPKPAGCGASADASFTRRYSKEDLESTGKFDTVEALRQLDTRLQ